MPLCFALFLLSLNASAQNNNSIFTEEEKGEMKKDMIVFVQSLELTEEQKPDFFSISKKYGAQMLALKDSDTSKFRKYRKVKSINKSRNKEMKKLLSKEQFKIYSTKQKEMQKEVKAKYKNG